MPKMRWFIALTIFVASCCTVHAQSTLLSSRDLNAAGPTYTPFKRVDYALNTLVPLWVPLTVALQRVEMLFHQGKSDFVIGTEVPEPVFLGDPDRSEGSQFNVGPIGPDETILGYGRPKPGSRSIGAITVLQSPEFVVTDFRDNDGNDTYYANVAYRLIVSEGGGVVPSTTTYSKKGHILLGSGFCNSTCSFKISPEDTYDIYKPLPLMPDRYIFALRGFALHYLKDDHPIGRLSIMPEKMGHEVEIVARLEEYGHSHPFTVDLQAVWIPEDLVEEVGEITGDLDKEVISGFGDGTYLIQGFDFEREENGPVQNLSISFRNGQLAVRFQREDSVNNLNWTVRYVKLP